MFIRRVVEVSSTVGVKLTSRAPVIWTLARTVNPGSMTQVRFRT
jgi:hypothetical protein